MRQKEKKISNQYINTSNKNIDDRWNNINRLYDKWKRIWRIIRKNGLNHSLVKLVKISHR